jgi:hypothetical protein
VACTHARKEEVIPTDCLTLPYPPLGLFSYVIWVQPQQDETLKQKYGLYLASRGRKRNV